MLDTASPQPEPLLTLDELAKYLSERGFKITPRYLGKLSTPLVNQGPPFECWWGTRKLFSPAKALAWAQARCRSHSPLEAA
jgi:hypothetical protein